MSSLSLFSGLALQRALTSDVIPRFTAEFAVEIECTFEPTSVLERTIRSGHVPDILIGVSSAVERLIQEGIFRPTSGPFVSSAVGIAVPPGDDAPRFDGASEFADFLVAARSVAYSRTGASGIYFADLLSRLGIAEKVDARATIFDGGFTATAVADGRADVAVQQLSELLSVASVQVVDGFPSELRDVTPFTAAISVGSQSPDAPSFLAELRSAGSQVSFARTGLTPVEA